jgi:hypothetical protein
MGVASTTNRKRFVGNGSTSQFSISDIAYTNSADIVVKTYESGSETTLQSGYSVSLVGTTTPYVTFVSAPDTGVVVAIWNSASLAQEYAFDNNGTFYAKDHEEALDHIVILAQQTQDEINRAVKIRISDDHDTSTDTTVASQVETGVVAGAAIVANGDLALEWAPGADAAGRTGIAAVAAHTSGSLASGYAASAEAAYSNIVDMSAEASESTSSLLDTYGKIGLIVVLSTESISASAGHVYQMEPAAGSSAVVTLPPTPAEGDQVIVKSTTNAWRSVSIDGNGNPIEQWSSIELVYPQESVQLIFDGDSAWREHAEYESGYDTVTPYMEWVSNTQVTVQAKPGYDSVFAMTMQDDRRYWTDGAITLDVTVVDSFGGVYDGPLVANGFGYVYMVPDVAGGRGKMNAVISTRSPDSGPSCSTNYAYIGILPMVTSQSVAEFSQFDREFILRKPEEHRVIVNCTSSAYASQTWHLANSDLTVSCLPATSSMMLARIKTQFHSAGDCVTIQIQDGSAAPSGGDTSSPKNTTPEVTIMDNDIQVDDIAIPVTYTKMYFRPVYWSDCQGTTKVAASAVEFYLHVRGWVDDWIE